MFLRLFRSKSPLEEESVQWIFEVFGWALRNLDAEVFYRDTILVTPTNEHFPGRAGSVAELVSLMFDRTLAYAGMQSWPVRLLEPGASLPVEVPKIALPSPIRSAGDTRTAIAQSSAAGRAILVPYDSALVNNPEAMIAGFAQVLAHYLGSSVREAPPGGIPEWPQTTEVLAVFMGFGLLFANTAFNLRSRACGSCSGPPVDRQVYLSQYDVTYALALFCTLKSIPNRAVLPHLKKTLRSHFKQCRKDVESRKEQLRGLPAPAVEGHAGGSASVAARV